jgi:phosphoglycolate phosphatase
MMPFIRVDDAVIECRLVLFDLDGTLVDKEFRNRSLAEARMTAIREIAGDDAAQLWAKLSGVNPATFDVDIRGPLSKAPRREDLTVATAAIWLNRMNWFKARELATEAYASADAQQSRKYKPALIRGVESTLRGMKDAGLRLGVATNGSGGTAREIMRSIGVETLFDVFIGADEVPEGKPAPDMILAACERLGVPPEEAVYVGDEVVDAVAGRAARVRDVVVVNAEDDVSRYTSHVVDSVACIRAG